MVSGGDRRQSFRQVAWLYVFCRGTAFRDDTERISASLWPRGVPADGTKLIEFGCGPGFYSCRLAGRYPQLSVVGVDRSDRQLSRARGRAQTLGLRNCRFERVNVLDIPCDDSDFDVLVASRLFTVLPERDRAVAEMHRVLRPGGRCFIAEPRHALRASVALGPCGCWLADHSHNVIASHAKAVVSRTRSLPALRGPAVAQCHCWHDGRYQYALCEKA